MIEFNYEVDFNLEEEQKTKDWIQNCIAKEGFELGEINYVFCNDDYLHKINVEFLQHDTFTDIISFDYTLGKEVSGDVFISVERVRDNAKYFNVSFKNEMHRVLIHGVLHYLGFNDKNDEEKQTMRLKENEYLNLID